MRVLEVAIGAVAALGQVACANHGDPLKVALSSGRWEGVLRGNGGNSSGTASGFLRAQHFLAGNRNGEAVCELLKEDSAALEQYQAMTHGFAGRYPKSAVAQYLRGDALARSAKWSEAIAFFDRALSLDESFVLARMARGVALVSSGRLQEGKRDLYSASMTDPEFAEAQAAMGWTLLKEGQPASTARKYFDAALKLSPEYSLASAGKGLAEIVSGNSQHGADEIERELTSRNCSAVLLVSNALIAAGWIRDPRSREINGAPGTEIKSTIHLIDNTFDRFANGDRSAVNSVIRMVGDNPSLQPRLERSLAAMKLKDPALYNDLKNNAHGNADFDKPAGLAEGMLHASDFALEMAHSALGLAKNAPLINLGGAALDWSAKDRIEHQLKDNTPMDYKGWSAVDRLLNPARPQNLIPPPGGATTSLSTARFDQGHWSFGPVFGLLYPTS